MTESTVDVLVVGAGPAGLSAALALGRGLKSVLVCDAGQRRNAAAQYMHGFVTRDGIAPAEFRRIGRQQLQPYAVRVLDVGVQSVQRTAADGFSVLLADGSRAHCRRILLATGMQDVLPELPNLHALWGHSVFACPYCHGWELRDRRWGFVGDAAALDFALLLRGWTSRLTLFTQGAAFSEADRQRLQRAGIGIEPRPLRGLCASSQHELTGVELTDGEILSLEALVLRPPQRQVSLVQALDLALDAAGFVRLDEHGQTSVAGIHAAGDLANPMQSALLAAAAGTRAAYQLNQLLNLERADSQPDEATT